MIVVCQSDQSHVITWFETGAGGQNVGQVQADHIWKQNYTFTMENVPCVYGIWDWPGYQQVVVQRDAQCKPLHDVMHGKPWELWRIIDELGQV